MAILNILTIPDERLRRKARPVTNIQAVQPFIDDLIETLYSTGKGIGIAATQVGNPHAIMVIDLSETRDQAVVFINPEIVEQVGEYEGVEGCLSIPGYRTRVTRYKQVKVSALDRKGEPFEVETDEFLAIVLQHEIDHLNGIVFTDHLSELKQKIALKKVKKWAEKVV
ncbi:peptide deformylase [uncultured Shewanella sp.]|uniref:peptide deformylase n=1 Tax=uncultured Shewanella sp. TaxID=173975 RepID=UPI002637FA44|nr:peptide deformylase [uncultured Shewanella sp.]